MKNISKNHINPINPINPINHGSDNSYDIIKAHRGEIKVETKDGKFSEFVIQLPSK
ncbi:hypothetical protein BH20BAC1_BH20BAC1_24050 [soil metagenome]